MKSTPNRSFRTVTCRHFWSGASCLRMAVAVGAFALSPPTEAGSLSPLSTLASTATPTPNNDNYEGTFSGNTNKATFNSNAVPVASGTISHLEAVFAVVDSNGTTEYRGATVLGTVTASAVGIRTIVLNAAGLAVVQGWVNNPATNFGFILQDYANTIKDDLAFSSREATIAAVGRKSSAKAVVMEPARDSVCAALATSRDYSPARRITLASGVRGRLTAASAVADDLSGAAFDAAIAMLL